MSDQTSRQSFLISLIELHHNRPMTPISFTPTTSSFTADWYLPRTFQATHNDGWLVFFKYSSHWSKSGLLRADQQSRTTPPTRRLPETDASRKSPPRYPGVEGVRPLNFPVRMQGEISPRIVGIQNGAPENDMRGWHAGIPPNGQLPFSVNGIVTRTLP